MTNRSANDVPATCDPGSACRVAYQQRDTHYWYNAAGGVLRSASHTL